MKLLSTLFTTLALVASVLVAPKAVAQEEDNNHFEDSEFRSMMDYATGANAAILQTTPTYDAEKGFWTIHLTKQGYETYQYITLYIKAGADGFGTGKTYTFDDFMPDADHQSSYYGSPNRKPFLKMRDITLSGNPLSGPCEISGTALYVQNASNNIYYACKFSYVTTGEAYEPQHYPLTFTSATSTRSVGKWDIMLGSKWADDYVKVMLDAESSTVFEGTYDLSNCVGTETECKIGGLTRKFKTLSFTLTGDPADSWSITGNGSFDNDDTVEFSYVGVKTKESVVFQYDYASYYNADHNVVIPEGVEACVVYVDSEGLHVTPAYTKDEVVSAGTPVLLHGSGIVTLSYTETTGKDLEGFVENHLVGAATDLQATDITNKYSEDDYYFYALMLGEADNAESEGFYWNADEGKAFEVPAGKAYLPVLKSLVDSLSGARSGFSFSDATGIRTVATEAQHTAAFNIHGQRVQEAKGLVIREGKMMFVK